MPVPVAAAAAPAAAESGMGAAGLAAGGQAFSGAAQGLGAAAAGKQAAKATRYSAKKAAREQKRRTLADLLNEALKREFEASQQASNRQQKYRTDEAQVLQNLASQYVQALR